MSWEVTLVMMCLGWICCFYIFYHFVFFFSLLPCTCSHLGRPAVTGLCLQEWSKDEWSLGKCDDSAKGLGGCWKGWNLWRWLSQVGTCEGAGGASECDLELEDRYIYIYNMFKYLYIYVHTHTANGCKWYMILIIHEVWCDDSRYILFSGRHFHKMLMKLMEVWNKACLRGNKASGAYATLWDKYFVSKCCNVNTLCLVFCFGGSTTKLDITTINNIQTPPTWSEQTACCWWVFGIFRMYQTLFCVRDTTGQELRILAAGKFKR